MVRIALVFFTSVIAIASAADVFPSCGKREPRVVKAGDSCGGPHVCSENTTCATLDESIKMPSWESSYVCTKPCATDADCSGLSMPMRCGAKGRLKTNDYSKPSEMLCVPTVATKPD